MKRLLLVRHAPAGWPEGEQARYRGWSDAPLAERGLREAELLARRLSHECGISAVYSSDLTRASRTAREICRSTGAPLRVRRDLREMHFGDWEGLSYAEVRSREPALCRRWLEDPASVSPPNGETLAACNGRVLEGLSAIERKSARNATAVLVGHGGPLRLIVCHLLGMPPDHHWRVRLDTSSVTTFEWVGGEPVLSGLNDLSHLESKPAAFRACLP